MGPANLSDHQNFDVGPHPHIGLSTLTYLFEGNIMHRDSLGTAVEIRAGEVNWMTAGKGIVHSERTPEYLRTSDKMLHGLQIWVALPKELEQMEPAFFHAGAHEIPEWTEGGIQYKLIAGTAFGRQSPVPVYSKLFLVEIKAAERITITPGASISGEVGLYVLEGSVENDGERFEPRRILVAKNGNLCRFTMEAGTTVYLFGGEPLPEERHIYWNFVASDMELIEQAKRNWADQQFPEIAGETGHVPLPAGAFSLRQKS